MSLLLIGTLGILLSAFLGGVTGFGYALVSVPFLLLAGLPLGDVVVVNLALGLLTRVNVLWQLRAYLDSARTGLLLAGAAPGLAIGYLLARHVDVTVLEIGAGCTVLLCGLAALAREVRTGTQKRASRATVALSGGVGGALGVTTSLNGAVPALVLRGDGTGRHCYVANLAAYFVVTNSISLMVLAASGLASTSTPLWVAACWLGAGLVGNLLGMTVLGRVREMLFHRITLGVVLASGTVALVQSLTRLE